jgi:hypothetical protein
MQVGTIPTSLPLPRYPNAMGLIDLSVGKWIQCIVCEAASEDIYSRSDLSRLRDLSIL